MEVIMTKLRVWRIWKKLKRLTVSAAYEDRATGDRVNDFCQSLSRDLGQHCELRKWLRRGGWNLWLNHRKRRRTPDQQAEPLGRWPLLYSDGHGLESLPGYP